MDIKASEDERIEDCVHRNGNLIGAVINVSTGAVVDRQPDTCYKNTPSTLLGTAVQSMSNSTIYVHQVVKGFCDLNLIYSIATLLYTALNGLPWRLGEPIK